MSKWIFPFALCFLVSCDPGNVKSNVLDPKSELGLSLQLGIGSSIPFECGMNPANNSIVGKLDQIDLDCNLPLDSREFKEKFQRENPKLEWKEGIWRTDASVSIKIANLSSDQSVPIKLSSILSRTGRTLTNTDRQVIINNNLPSVELVGYEPLLDYSFFSNRYWDLEFNEPISELDLPLLTGSIAPKVRLRSIVQLETRKYRLFFETISLNNSPGTLNLEFSKGKDSAGNSIQRTFQIKFIGLTEGPNLVSERSSPFVFHLANGSVVAINGRNKFNANQSEILRVGQSSFQVLASILYPAILGQTATLLNDESILLVGGQDLVDSATATIHNRAELLNPNTDNLTILPNLTFPRTYHSATLLADGRVLIAGGIVSFTSTVAALSGLQPFASTNRTLLYDPNSKTFSDGPNMSVGRSHQCAIRLNDGRVWLAGGFSRIISAMLETTEFYNPSSNSFSAGPLLPIPNSLFNCTLLGDGNVILSPGTEILSSNSIFLFDVKANKVTLLPALRFGRMASALAVGQDDSFLLFGGGATNIANQATRLIEKFDYKKSNVFLDLGFDLEPRTFFSPVRLSNGSIFLIGGQASDGSTSRKTYFYGPRPTSN